MAQQLLQNRTGAAYSGVEAFARKHGGEDAGSLAWLAVGYAHFLDHDYGKAIEPLNRARPHAGDIGDYVAYYLAASYLQSGRSAEGMASLGTFDKTFPGSLLIRDGHVLYANALLTDNRPKEAVALLESDREPIRAQPESQCDVGLSVLDGVGHQLGHHHQSVVDRAGCQTLAERPQLRACRCRSVGRERK